MKVKKEKLGLWKSRVLVLPLLILAYSFCSPRAEPEHKQVLRRQIVGLAKNLAGIPYRFGGNDIDGFDCSGLVFYVYDCFGIRIPRNAREQGRMNGNIKLKYAAPGDILIFKLKKIWHSAIFMDNQRFIHAPKTGGWVRFENLDEYWLSHLYKVITVWPQVN
ncbi:MAG: C40 family peptidase [Chrysiogenales bacterium]